MYEHLDFTYLTYVVYVVLRRVIRRRPEPKPRIQISGHPDVQVSRGKAFLGRKKIRGIERCLIQTTQIPL